MEKQDPEHLEAAPKTLDDDKKGKILAEYTQQIDRNITGSTRR